MCWDQGGWRMTKLRPSPEIGQKKGLPSSPAPLLSIPAPCSSLPFPALGLNIPWVPSGLAHACLRAEPRDISSPSLPNSSGHRPTGSPRAWSCTNQLGFVPFPVLAAALPLGTWAWRVLHHPWFLPGGVGGGGGVGRFCSLLRELRCCRG